ncbi:hypothetical protein C8J56DRAFT_927295 [Mycena floridula]|nr:hypothetical protein C8J56DRAFT_927295 [Mycena floridula]
MLSSRFVLSRIPKLRTMSTRNYNVIVYAPDKADEGAHARRYKVRARHMEGMAPLIEAGILKIGGMTVTPETMHLEGEERKPIGSVLIFAGKSLEEVKALVEKDIYWEAEVWDHEKLTILPIFMATPK